MADEIAHWQEALRNLEAANREAERIVRIIHNASASLDDWKDATVSNIGVSFPIGLPIEKAINAKEWPAAQELAEALASWHTAAHEVRNAWSAIPMTEKKGLAGPGV